MDNALRRAANVHSGHNGGVHEAERERPCRQQMAADLAKTYLYHITDVQNLPRIIATGALLSDSALAAAGGAKVNIGHDHIKHRRMTQIRVPCAAGRFVGEFVPFYFCPRSPMLYRVNKGIGNNPPGCQRTIVHLVTSVQHAVQTGNSWAFSDGGAGAFYTQFYNDLEMLSSLNWDAINAHYWQEVTTQKSAEFLVADRFDWGLIRGIGCYEDAAAEQVAKLLKDVDNPPAVSVKRSWYY